MTDRELLESIAARMDSMETKIGTMQGQIGTMQEDINVLKRTSALVETDIAPKVQLLLENHADLSKNVMVAKDIEERVGVLEFDVKIIKRLLETKAGA